MQKLSNLLNNELFRAGCTICTLGFGAFLFFNDFRRWMNDKLQPTSKKTHLTQILCTGSLLDNGIGMAWSRFAGGNKNAWKDHAYATSIQVPLLIFQKKLSKVSEFLPIVLLIVSVLLACRGWYRNFRYLLKK